MISSGCQEIDKMRMEVSQSPTTEENYEIRIFLMKQWACLLEQQGADLEDYLPIDLSLSRLSSWQYTHSKLCLPDEQLQELFQTVERGYSILENLQTRLEDEQRESEETSVADETDAAREGGERTPVDWPTYHGDKHHTGHTPAQGPRKGQVAWRAPIGLAWESRPVVENDRVYAASPGMRNILYCLDVKTGETIWCAKQLPKIVGDQLYSTPCHSSTPIVLKDSVVLRQMGSRGNDGPSRYLVFVDKETGRIVRKVEAGHVDYRAGYAPVAGNEEFIVFPHGIHDIEKTPPIAQPFNRIVCKETATGKLRWDYNLGHIFAEPLIAADDVLVGTKSGVLFCLHLRGNFAAQSSDRIKWQFQAEGAINRKVAVSNGRVYFGANDGFIYCLDQENGAVIWRHEIEEKEPRAFRLFSTPLVTEGKVYVGCANKRVYCLDSDTGRLLWSQQASDWVRARPAILEDRVYVATIDGRLHCYDLEGKPRWTKPIGEHPIYADITAAGDRLFLSSSHLYLYCVDRTGETLWRKSLIGCFYRNGRRLLTEQIAGGAYYQSKPTAVKGKVFYGTPSRFIYARCTETGKELWKFEMGGAISASPVYSDGRIYAGQQGGEDDFYCLDAKDGSPIWSQAVGWVWGSANVDGDKVYVPGIDGFINCLDGKTGAIIWRYRTARSTCTEPCIDGDTVFFGGWDHYLYAFDKHTGKMKWQFQLTGSSDSGAQIAYAGRIYLPVGGKSAFRCLDAETGDVLWEYSKPGANLNVTPAYHDGRVFVSVHHGTGMGGIPVVSRVYCLDAETGEEIWRHRGGGLTGPVVAAGRVYFASTSSPYLTCVDEEGNGDGTTRCYWRVRMENKVEESTPAIYNGKLFIVNSGGYLYAVE